MSDIGSFNSSIGKVLVPIFAAAVLAGTAAVGYGIYKIGYKAGQKAEAAKHAPANPQR